MDTRKLDGALAVAVLPEEAGAVPVVDQCRVVQDPPCWTLESTHSRGPRRRVRIRIGRVAVRGVRLPTVATRGTGRV